MSNKKFIADVSAFAKKTDEVMLRIAKQSLQDVINKAQTPVAQGGDMPVDLGFLRNSLETSLGGVEIASGADSAVLGIASLKLGDTISFAWTAEYAIPRHYAVGVGQGGGLWRDKAAQSWQQIVEKNAKAVK